MPLKVNGYRTQAAAATAHDHARLWVALRSASTGGEAPLPPETLVVVGRAVQTELNFPFQRYQDDAPLLPKLASISWAQLQQHLAPAALEAWAGGSHGSGGSASAARLRQDNTTDFAGVAHITGSTSFGAQITGASLLARPPVRPGLR